MGALFTQITEKRSILLRGKGFFLVLGLALLVAGLSLIIVYSVIIKPDRVLAESVNLTTTDHSGYRSNTFHAEKGDWIEFDLTTSNRSILGLYGETLGEVWRVVNNDAQAELSGAMCNQSVQINLTADYHVELENKAAHTVYFFGYPNDVYDNNTYSGNFYLMRMPTYYPHLLLTGEALLAASCGILVVPAVPYFLDKAKRLGTN